ncbi:hypothetical protein GPA19_20625 [Azoarcus indigens]|uniref:Uncharacterized protein n=1 Tax=Azoarcus indigens TaxID=29545 RepID=A0A4R6EFV7_9RHOO|nr:hypothetical protein [Azoarcus indigens]TDN57172.1 hypothetical protein C7389_101558 [Azoarcus indigens]
MPALAENRTVIELKTAKPTGLGITQLGVPVAEGTAIKKGKLHEFIQLLDDGKAGRRYQNLRVTGVKASEGGVESAKLFVQFEVFGDDNVPLGANSGFGAALCAGGETLLELASAPAFLPYARAWFENQFVFEVPVELFERADGVAFTARPDEVRLI